MAKKKKENVTVSYSIGQVFVSIGHNTIYYLYLWNPLFAIQHRNQQKRAMKNKRANTQTHTHTRTRTHTQKHTYEKPKAFKKEKKQKNKGKEKSAVWWTLNLLHKKSIWHTRHEQQTTINEQEQRNSKSIYENRIVHFSSF